MGDGVLHAAREHVGQFSGALLLGHLGSQLRSLHAALALQGADLHHLAAQGVTQLPGVDLVAVSADQVHHVHRHYHGRPSSISWVVRYRFRSILVPSTMFKMASGFSFTR